MLSLEQLRQLPVLDQVIITGLENQHYLLDVRVGAELHPIMADNRRFSAPHLEFIRQLLAPIRLAEVWLYQQNCFDEMVGQQASQPLPDASVIAANPAAMAIALDWHELAANL